MIARSLVSAFAMALALIVPATPADASTRGVFVARCAYSHSLKDDPIIHPGDPGASHRHDFFGSTITSATSTAAEMRAGETTCRLALDTAAYWFPTAYLGTTRIVATFSKAYYFGIAKGTVETIPRGLKIVGGNMEAASSADNAHATYFCGALGSRRSPKVDRPYDCTPYARRWPFVDGIVERVELPSCWDGSALGATDLAYASDTACPTGFEHRLPTMHLQVHLHVLDPCRRSVPCGPHDPPTGIRLHLSSGPYYTLHADLWNTWHQHALAHLTARCLNAHVICGFVKDP